MSQAFGYILKLENQKWYVGISQDPKTRIKKHFAGKGSAWTRFHKPLEVMTLKEIKEPSIWEKEKTLSMMRDKGWKNVRGYAWCQVNLKYPPNDL